MHVQWPGVNEPAFQFDICNQFMQLYMKHICIICILIYTPYNSINFIAFIMLGIYVSVIICMHISSFIQSGQQIIMSVKRASSIALTADGATAHTGESYVAVTGHWIDRVPQTGQNLQLARCSWKLLSAVLAVSVDNGMHIYNVSDMDISLS